MRWIRNIVRLVGRATHTSRPRAPRSTGPKLDRRRRHTGAGSLTQEQILRRLSEREPQTAAELAAGLDVTTVPSYLSMMVACGLIERIPPPPREKSRYRRTPAKESKAD